MRTVNFVTVLFLALSSSAFAQTVDKALPGSGDWKAAQVSGHDLWKKSACVAYTKTADSKSVLELYAEQEGELKGAFVEPTFQIVTKETGFVRGVLTDAAGGTPFQLTLASTREVKPAFGLLARFQDRAKLMEMLKKASGAKLSFVDKKGKAFKAVTFSLKGSTKTLEGAVAGCQLML